MRIVIVDDHVLMRRGLANIVEHGTPGVDVVEAGNASAALAAMRQERPTSRSSTSACRISTGWSCCGP